jgi:hypothetical protein
MICYCSCVKHSLRVLSPTETPLDQPLSLIILQLLMGRNHAHWMGKNAQTLKVFLRKLVNSKIKIRPYHITNTKQNNMLYTRYIEIQVKR